MAWNDNIEEDSPAYNLAASDSNTLRAVAGPGSGKSFAINKRILRLLESKVSPDKILAITFTRTAANDLKTEISSLGIQGAEQVHTRTVHSHALRILMKDDVLEQTGRFPRMVIEHEQEPILRDLDREEFNTIPNKKKLLDSYLAGWAKLQQDEVGFTESEIDQNFKHDLLEWFNNHNGILVGEVIPIVVEYLRNNPAVDSRNEYDYILVDEFQDLNKSEQEFIKLIRGDSNLVIVGDDDQSIYGFKYAHPQGIQKVDELFGKYTDISFDVCRRCPTLVTRMASELISKNPNRTLGDLIPYEENAEGRVDIVQWRDYASEINGLSNFILSELGKGVIEPSDILVLSPRRNIGYQLRDLLLAAMIPVKSYFRESVITKPHVKRSFSLLNFLANQEDKISLRFLLGFGKANFGKNQYSKLSLLARENNLSVKETLDAILGGGISRTHLSSIILSYEKIIADILKLKKTILDDPQNGFQNFFMVDPAQETDFYELDQVYRNSVNEIGVETIEDDTENFDVWLKKVMQSILIAIALPEPPENIDHVRIMSLHSSKGLSAKLVILTSMIDPLIPFLPENMTQDEVELEIQEARRLFYVAITRCKSTSGYDGRLLISSFLSIPGVEALRMGLKGNSRGDLRTMTSRFVTDFGRTSPLPIDGRELE